MRKKIGDIFEIPTRIGLAYGIYTHEDERYGELIQVFNGEYDERMTDFEFLVAQGIRWYTFFPLGAAFHRKIFERIGNIEIPPELQPYPTFRSSSGIEVGDDTASWWLRNDTDKQFIGKLTEEQKRISELAMVNDTMLIMMIESGWMPGSKKTVGVLLQEKGMPMLDPENEGD